MTVQNDDAAASFRSNVATVYESEGSVRLPVELSAPRGEPTLTRFSVIGTSATAGVDFAGGPYTVTIPTGQISATLDIGIVDDDLEELDETFVVSVSGGTLPSGVTLGSPGLVNVTIVDAPPPCTNCVRYPRQYRPAPVLQVRVQASRRCPLDVARRRNCLRTYRGEA